jgi:dipeptidyl aminopeptidase/acylaminoacyl peptidase
VDKKADWIYFAANDDQDRPYDIHFYRVNLEDNSFTRLTDAIGVHSIQFSPSKEFFLDTHSHTVRPPTVELKKANGELLQTLSKANIDALKEELKWVPPEEFVVKAADGKTDLWGLLYKPHDLNPKKKYPVINFVYTNFYPLTPGFGPHYCEEYTKLGFVIFQVWERGSPMRDKEFREVAFGNIGRYEIPDNVAALKQLAEKRPYMDLSRVGIHGGSWGGYASTRALLLAPDVYQVGIAERPYMELYDMAWIELFMGLPENNPEGYEYGSNLRLAKNLKGKLLLEVRTSDISAAFSQTMKMIDAFIRAGKGGHFELMVLPEATHLGPLSPAYRRYVDEARARFYIENLKPDIEK